MKTLSTRLEESINNREMSKRGFIKALQTHFDKVPEDERPPGLTFPSLDRYLKPRKEGGASPSPEWIRGAAHVLDVRASWLAYEEGPKNEAEAIRQEYAKIAADPERAWLVARSGADRVERDLERVREVETGTSAAAEARRTALIGFGQKLGRCSFTGAPWEDEGTRRELIECAAIFLRSVESSLRHAASQHPNAEPDSYAARLIHDHLLNPTPSSPAAYAMWLDRLLDHFCDRVMGLGVRTGGLYDSE